MSARTKKKKMKKKKKSRKRRREEAMDVDVDVDVRDQLKGLGFTQQQINDVFKDIDDADRAAQFDSALELLLANNQQTNNNNNNLNPPPSPPKKRRRIDDIIDLDPDDMDANNTSEEEKKSQNGSSKKTNLEMKEEALNEQKQEMEKHENEFKAWEAQQITLSKSLNEIRDNINNLYSKRPAIAEKEDDVAKLQGIIDYAYNAMKQHLDFCNKRVDDEFVSKESKKQKLDNERFSFEQSLNEFESHKYALQLMQNQVKSGANVMSLVERNLFIVASAINGNQENVDNDHFKQLNRKIKAVQNNSNSKEEKNDEKIEFECGICFMGYSELSDILIFDECYHYYCMQCLGGWLTSKLQDRNVKNISCPFEGCSHKLRHQEISYILSKEEFKKFDEYLLDKTLQSAKDCRFCPGVDCGTAMFGYQDSPMLTCPKCKKQFCFNCGTEEWHKGVTCEAFRKWKEENGKGDVKFDEWVKGQNAKQCSQCNSMIEKNGGCDHMTCQNCKYEFHWVTGEKWKGHNHPYDVPAPQRGRGRGRGRGRNRARARDILQNMAPLPNNNNNNNNNNVNFNLQPLELQQLHQQMQNIQQQQIHRQQWQQQQQQNWVFNPQIPFNFNMQNQRLPPRPQPQPQQNPQPFMFNFTPLNTPFNPFR